MRGDRPWFICFFGFLVEFTPHEGSTVNQQRVEIRLVTPHADRHLFEKKVYFSPDVYPHAWDRASLIMVDI